MNFKNWIVDSTTVAAVCTPVFAGLETIVATMSNETSQHARWIGLLTTFAGGGSLYVRQLRASRKKADMGNGKSNGDFLKHDAAYGARFNLMTSPFLYLVSGSRSFVEIGIGTALATSLAYIAGGPFGYMLDAVYDFTGIQPAERIHPWLKDRSPGAKKMIAGLGLAASATATALIYHFKR